MADRAASKDWKRRAWWGVSFAAPLALLIVLACADAPAPIPEGDGAPGTVLWETAIAPAIPATEALLLRGHLVYEVRCASCHGIKGDGNGPASQFLETRPRNYTKLVFKFRTTKKFPSDLDLFRSVTAGFPAYGMPPFEYMPERDRWAVVYYLKNLAKEGWIEALRKEKEGKIGPDEAEALAARKMDTGALVSIGPEPPADAGSLARGKEVYDKSCIPCHGIKGRGDGVIADRLTDYWGESVRPRDLWGARAFRKAGWRTADTARLVKTGIGGTPMPAFDLSNQALWDLARYVEHIEEQSTGPGQ